MATADLVVGRADFIGAKGETQLPLRPEKRNLVPPEMWGFDPIEWDASSFRRVFAQEVHLYRHVRLLTSDMDRLWPKVPNTQLDEPGRRGRKPRVRHEIAAKMIEQLLDGDISPEDLVALKDEALVARFGSRPDTARKTHPDTTRKAREAALADPRVRSLGAGIDRSN